MRLTTAHEGEGTCRGEHSRRAFGQVPSTLVVLLTGRDAIFDRRSLPPGSCRLTFIRSSPTEPGSRRAFTRLDILFLQGKGLPPALEAPAAGNRRPQSFCRLSAEIVGQAVRDHRKGKRTDCWRLNANQSFIFSFPVVSVPSAHISADRNVSTSLSFVDLIDEKEGRDPETAISNE